MAQFPEDDYAPDPELGDFMRRHAVKSPLEDVVATHHTETVLRFGIVDRRRVVELTCGHVVFGQKRVAKMRCPRCQAMIEEGRDFVSFRYLDRGLRAP